MILAEDNILTSMILRTELEKSGYTVSAVARSGPEVIGKWRSMQPDVVVLDVMLPETDGLKVTRAMMEERPTCVVIITGMGDYQQHADDAGAMGYVEKPFEVEQLAAEIERARTRFDWFNTLCASEQSPEAALDTWRSVFRAVKQLASKEHVPETEALHRLQQTAVEQQLSLREAAEREAGA
jgi:response regulator NasT